VLYKVNSQALIGWPAATNQEGKLNAYTAGSNHTGSLVWNIDRAAGGMLTCGSAHPQWRPSVRNRQNYRLYLNRIIRIRLGECYRSMARSYAKILNLHWFAIHLQPYIPRLTSRGLLAYFPKMEIGLWDHNTVCLAAFPLSIFKPIYRFLWNLAGMWFHSGGPRCDNV
jgi:hypothetical protein